MLPCGMRPRRIVVVEDNPADAQLLVLALTAADPGIAVETISTGHAAIARLERCPPYEDALDPDLVVLDLQLPGILGHELLSLLRDDARQRRVRCAVLTASDDPAQRAWCLAGGADLFLRKPDALAGYEPIAQRLVALVPAPERGG